MPITLTNKEIWENVSRLLALIAVPALAWAFALQGERAADKVIQQQTERRISSLEEQLKQSAEALVDLKVILAGLSKSAENMKNELERLRDK